MRCYVDWLVIKCERKIFVFMVSKWLCVNGVSECGFFKRLIDIGWLLMMVFIMYMRVYSWFVV